LKYLKYPLILAVVLITVYSFLSTQGPQVVVEPHQEYKQTTYYLLDKAGGKISIVTYQTDLNAGILRLRSTSLLPLDEQLKLLSKILDRVLVDEDKGKIHTLFVGRLLYAFGEKNPQMSDRLSAAAANSPLWNKRRGRPVTGHENKFVNTIANEAAIYPELKAMFNKHGLNLKFSSAEKVLVNSDRLPYDCLAWFSISKD
jgi:hypothetical protein